MTKTQNIISWIARLIAVAIMGQTLFFKFTNHPTTTAIFDELGAPGGGYLIGGFELVACILLLVPRGVVFGSILGCGLMAGALASHAAVLGFAGERGELAALGAVTLACCLTALILHRRSIPIIGKRF